MVECRDESFVCTMNHMVSLKSDTLAFIESPNFPKFMTDDERRECSFNFTNNITASEIHQKFIFVPTNVICADPDEDYCPRDFLVFENISSYYFDIRKHNFYNTSLGYTAFQGFVIFDDWGDTSCPLESVSRVSPFQFNDENQILKIQSNFYEFKNRTHPCLWQFSAPNGFGFKISITHLDISNTTKFTVKNSTVIITNQNLVRKNFPYYNNDNYLKISLSGNDYGNQKRRMELEAIISIIKNNFVQVEDNCVTVPSEDGTTWTNLNGDTIGYPNNAYCSYELIIEPGTEVVVYDLILIIEEYADHMNYYPDGNESLPVDYNLQTGGYIVFYPYDRETERSVFWEFTSDGSWRSHGFRLLFAPYVCSCSYNIMTVSCFGRSTYNFMPNEEGFYCGNLECNFTIIIDSFCSATHIKMILETTSNKDNADNTDQEIFDIFKFISDDIIQLEINHTNRYLGSWTLYMSTKTNNSLYAITVPSFTYRKFTLSFSTFNVPTNIPTIELNDSNPYYSYYLCPKSTPTFFLIKLSSELIVRNATIDIHSATEDMQRFLAFYDNKNLTHRINFRHCFLSDTPYAIVCKTQSSQFIVTQFDLPYDIDGDQIDSCSVIIFQSTTVYSENCVFEKNVYNVTLNKQLSITAMSKKNKICTVFFLISSYDYNYYFKRIWMSPQRNESLKIYVGNEFELLTEIYSDTSLSWQNIILNSLIYTIKIPSNSAVMIDIALYKYHLNIPTFPFHSVLTSLRYGISHALLGGLDSRVATYDIYNFDANFTIEKFNISDAMFCFFDSNDTMIPINASSEFMVFGNTELGVSCVCVNEDDYCSEPYELFISIETLDNFEETKTTKKIVPYIPPTTTTKKIALANGISLLSYNFLLILLCLFSLI